MSVAKLAPAGLPQWLTVPGVHKLQAQQGCAGKGMRGEMDSAKSLIPAPTTTTTTVRSCGRGAGVERAGRGAVDTLGSEAGIWHFPWEQ